MTFCVSTFRWRHPRARATVSAGSKRARPRPRPRKAGPTRDVTERGEVVSTFKQIQPRSGERHGCAADAPIFLSSQEQYPSQLIESRRPFRRPLADGVVILDVRPADRSSARRDRKARPRLVEGPRGWTEPRRRSECLRTRVRSGSEHLPLRFSWLLESVIRFVRPTSASTSGRLTIHSSGRPSGGVSALPSKQRVSG